MSGTGARRMRNLDSHVPSDAHRLGGIWEAPALGRCGEGQEPTQCLRSLHSPRTSMGGPRSAATNFTEDKSRA
eukprot:2069932-Alexandrium_andersonii.AAC.1